MPSFLSSRAAILRRRPLVVGVLTGARDVPRQLRAARSPLVDLVEIRLDTFQSLYAPNPGAAALDLVRRVRRTTRKPLLLTLRAHTERGSTAPARERLSDEARAALLAPLLPLAAMIDVEARHPEFARRLTALARRRGVDVIHSFHDFKGPGRTADLNRWSRASQRAGADIFKAAVTPTDARYLAVFLAWGAGLRGIHRVLIGMGPAGAPSRTMAYSFGSILAFGHLGVVAAPGQLSAADVGRAVRDIYGAGK